MSELTNVLGYLAGLYTQSEISQATGIPQSTLSYAIRGLRPLPNQYRETVWRLKNNVAYAELFNVGVPSVQASLLSLDSVADVKNHTAYVKAVADKLTIGYIETVMADGDERLTDQQYIDKYYADAYNDIINSLRASEKPIWQWQDYLSPDEDQ